MWREIRDTGGRYIINEEGRIIDRRPPYNETDWSFEPVDVLPSDNDMIYYQLNSGKWKHSKLSFLLKEHFKDHMLHREEEEKIKRKIADPRQPTISYSVETLNKILFPNKVICIYCKYNNTKHVWKKPFRFDMRQRKNIVLHKGFKYFGVGTHNLINFDNYFPKNGKPTVESFQKEYARKKASQTEKKQIHHTELWDD